jgi:hypothetical protein
MRPTRLGHGVYKDDIDYSVFCGEWCIGRIYEKRSAPQHLRWFWSLFCPSMPGEMRTSNQVATLDEAKAEFEASWKRWKTWADCGKLPTEDLDPTPEDLTREPRRAARPW